MEEADRWRETPIKGEEGYSRSGEKKGGLKKNMTQQHAKGKKCYIFMECYIDSCRKVGDMGPRVEKEVEVVKRNQNDLTIVA